MLLLKKISFDNIISLFMSSNIKYILKKKIYIIYIGKKNIYFINYIRFKFKNNRRMND